MILAFALAELGAAIISLIIAVACPPKPPEPPEPGTIRLGQVIILDDITLEDAD